MAEIRTDGSVLREVLTLQGLRVLDIGSGAGGLVRSMTRHGARVTGLECGAAQLEKAYATAREGDEEYVEGVGQDLPFEDASFDAAVFFNSLHHIPVEHMSAALGEAARVVRPGGTVYIAEPIASGSGFELHAPIDDETMVRAQAYGALSNVQASDLIQEREIAYETMYHYADYEEFRDESVRIDPTRAALFEAMDTELRESFEHLGIHDTEKGWRFDQPMRVNVLRKAHTETGHTST